MRTRWTSMPVSPQTPLPILRSGPEMWGEIESCIKPASPAPYEPDSGGTEDEDKMDQCASEPSNPTAHIQDKGSSLLDGMLSAIVDSGSPVKSQQLGEPDLTMEEKKQLLLEQYNTKPVVFLERYHTHLKPKHLEAFSHVSSDCRTQYYCTEVQKRASSSANKTRVRNHRYAALRALQKEGQYFSEEQMRFREPLLYEQYIGQYLSEEEILQRAEEAMQKGPIGLSDLLINSYQEKELQKRLQEEQGRENCAEQEEEEDDEEPPQAEWEPTAEEKAMLREEFLSQMHQRFLEGKDEDFNYSEVDENPDYDNLDILTRDAEERYFDEDEEEEEEEEENEEEEEENEGDSNMV
ncbi:coiled-coil domain-containing protein 97 isoform X1 [Pangasianodon hypophthalmus]|uniref:coiled-coil domain-containing protein 97 isoform X1 n=2 Tax=Pangasianodon hypophthalmus TaxID=310915 RepID=UPI002307AB45|nr:coiled-coil domain-containing protein 97 isoform X1 [Pangasianodon hypophthalmus]